jgi:hypothetical protein
MASVNLALWTVLASFLTNGELGKFHPLALARRKVNRGKLPLTQPRRSSSLQWPCYQELSVRPPCWEVVISKFEIGSKSVLRVVLLKFTKLEKVELNIRQPFGQVHVLLELSLAIILAYILHRLSHETAPRVVCKRGK